MKHLEQRVLSLYTMCKEDQADKAELYFSEKKIHSCDYQICVRPEVKLGEDAEKKVEKIELVEPRMSSYYGTIRGKSVSADKGCDGDAEEFFHTKQGLGQWWAASFFKPKYVTMVKILNRHDDAECADRLAKCKVMIGGEYFGKLPSKTLKGKWYNVIPNAKKPVLGKSVKIETTADTCLHFADIYVYGYDFVDDSYETHLALKSLKT